jgi:peptidoglycan/xylan/chitin deacetylase (PgdA/CDA1 family)
MALACRGKPGGVIINEHTLTAKQTRFHVDVLSRWFDLISHDELPDRLARPRTRPFCLLSFDDGKRSHATQVAPELARLGVPAIFFVTTGFLTEGTALWFDRYTALRRVLGSLPAGLEPETVKQLPLALLTERLDRACARHGVTPDLASDDIRPMSWSEARELASAGFTVGSHGQRHAILTREIEATALSEIEQSCAAVSTEVGAPCTTFAFPNGNYTARLAHHAVQCGARTVMTTDPTWVDPRFPLWRLPRVQLSGTLSRARIELKLALAATGRLLVNPDGTGRLYRRTQGL